MLKSSNDEITIKKPKLKINSKVDELEHGSILLIGSTMTGKTHLLKWLVLKKLRKQYDLIILFSGYLDPDDYDFLPREHMFEDKIMFKNKIEQLMSENKRIKESGENPPYILVILDDIVGSISRNKLDDMMLYEMIASRGRHLNIFAVFAIQNITLVTPTIRNNSHYIITNSLPGTQIDILYNIVGHACDKKKLAKYIVYACQDYCFLVFNVFSTKLDMWVIKADAHIPKYMLEFNSEY